MFIPTSKLLSSSFLSSHLSQASKEHAIKTNTPVAMFERRSLVGEEKDAPLGSSAMDSSDEEGEQDRKRNQVKRMQKQIVYGIQQQQQQRRRR